METERNRSRKTGTVSYTHLDVYKRQLYYCMRSVVEGNLHQAWNYGRDTFLYALGIAAGMSIAWAICDFLRKIRGKQEIS